MPVAGGPLPLGLDWTLKQAPVQWGAVGRDLVRDRLSPFQDRNKGNNGFHEQTKVSPEAQSMI